MQLLSLCLSRSEIRNEKAEEGKMEKNKARKNSLLTTISVFLAFARFSLDTLGRLIVKLLRKSKNNDCL